MVIIGDLNQSIASESSEADRDLDNEEQEWQEMQTELHAQKVERAKKVFKKVLLPTLEEMRLNMLEDMNN